MPHPSAAAAAAVGVEADVVAVDAAAVCDAEKVGGEGARPGYGGGGISGRRGGSSDRGRIEALEIFRKYIN